MTHGTRQRREHALEWIAAGLVAFFHICRHRVLQLQRRCYERKRLYAEYGWKSPSSTLARGGATRSHRAGRRQTHDR